MHNDDLIKQVRCTLKYNFRHVPDMDLVNEVISSGTVYKISELIDIFNNNNGTVLGFIAACRTINQKKII